VGDVPADLAGPAHRAVGSIDDAVRGVDGGLRRDHVGEVQNLIRLELVQGGRRVVLDERRGRLSAINTIDPRLFRERRIVVVSEGQLAGFAAGPATVRLTVFGGQKLPRTPGPRTREFAVNIVR
jgi:hypothetical protein